MKYATFWQRFAAAWIDFFVLLPFTLIQSWLGSASKTAALVLVLPMTSAYLGYTIYCHGRFGQTVGKYAMGIRVLRTTGERVGWREAWLRSSIDVAFSVLGVGSSFIALAAIADTQYYDVGWVQRAQNLQALEPTWLAWTSTASQIWAWSELVTMLFNKRRRALHDFIAGTVVKAKQRTTDAEPQVAVPIPRYWREQSPMPRAYWIAYWGLAALGLAVGIYSMEHQEYDFVRSLLIAAWMFLLVPLMFKRARRFKYLSAFCFVSLGGLFVWLAWSGVDSAVRTCLGVRNQGVAVQSLGCDIVKAVPQPRFSPVIRCIGGKEPKCEPTSTTASLFAGFSNKIESKYFIFYSDLPRRQLENYTEFSNLFLDLVDRDFVGLRNFTRITAIAFPDQNTMQRFLTQRLARNGPPVFGTYLEEHHLFLTYDGSGLGTFTHEIMHPVVRTELPQTPSWAWEGIPAFFEKFYGYKEGNRLYLKWGYQNPWRIQALGERLLTANLADIIHRSHDQSEQRLVSIFLYRRGKWKTFLDLIDGGDKRGYATYVEAAFGLHLNELEHDWRTYVQHAYARRNQIYQLPASRLFSSKQEFLEFDRQLGMQ